MVGTPLRSPVASRGPLFALVLLGFLVPGVAPGVAHAAPPSPATSAPANAASANAPTDDGEANSPRAVAAAFLAACRGGDYAEASKFLDLSKAEAARGTELARRLDAVLARKLWIEPKTLSPYARGGKESDGKGAAFEELGVLTDKKGRKIPIRLLRREEEAEPRWVFSKDVTGHIDEWYEALGDRWIREHVPDALLRPGPKDLLLGQWAAIPLFLLVAALLGRLGAWLTRSAVRPLASHAAPAWEEPLGRRLQGPLALAIACLVLYATSGFLALYEPAEVFYIRCLRAAFFVSVFWALLRAVAAIAEIAKSAAWAKDRRGAVLLSDFGTRVARIAILALGGVAVLSELGYPVTSLLAGLGVGGIAVALAAQKTMEHLFGSVAILADQPFRVGDTVRVEGVLGTVEAIGLRSTRIRTEDRTMVVWPNGKLADLRIENLATRDRYRHVFDLKLSGRTPIAALAPLFEALREELAKEEVVVAEACLIHVTHLSGDTIEVDITVTATVASAVAFLPVRERLWLAFLTTLDRQRVSLATSLPQPPRFPDPPAAAE